MLGVLCVGSQELVFTPIFQVRELRLRGVKSLAPGLMAFQSFVLL